MPERIESSSRHFRRPAFEAPIRAVAFAVPAFLVVATRVRREENAARFERGADLAENSGQLGTWDMKERRVREDPVEARDGQVEREKVLLQHLASGIPAGHLAKSMAALEPDGFVSERSKVSEIAPRSAAEIEDSERRRRGDGLEQRRVVL